jgi:nucleotide-binding universal stress UspA family protein
MRPIEAILVPTDFGEASRQALAYALELAEACGASLHLLHVIEDPFAGVHMDMAAAPPEGYFEHVDWESRSHLASMVPEDPQRHHRVLLATRMGDAAAEILNYVRDHPEIGLVVIGRSPRGTLSRLMTGSVTGDVVHGSPCPVLTVHAHERVASSGRTRAA